MNQAVLPSKARISTSIAASLLLWLSRTLLALLAAYPVLSVIAATGIGNGPDRDAVLFQPGSLLLLEALRVGMPWLSSALSTALLLSALCAVAELIPLAGALDLLLGAERSTGARALRAVRCFARFLGLGAIAWITQGALLLAASLLDAALKSALQAADERVQSLAPLALFALALLACLGVNGMLDLARAAVVERDLGARAALTRALRVLRERRAGVLAGCYASAAANVLAYLVAAWAMTRVDLSGRSGAAIVLCFAVHQAAILFGIAWRVRWLTRTLELSAPQADSGRD
jgi:hypothetical protein